MNPYLATDTTNARDRTKLFHLAWDVPCSAFNSRQVLYERMFGGGPVRHALSLFQNDDREPFAQRVRDCLDSSHRKARCSVNLKWGDDHGPEARTINGYVSGDGDDSTR